MMTGMLPGVEKTVVITIRPQSLVMASARVEYAGTLYFDASVVLVTPNGHDSLHDVLTQAAAMAIDKMLHDLHGRNQ